MWGSWGEEEQRSSTAIPHGCQPSLSNAFIKVVIYSSPTRAEAEQHFRVLPTRKTVACHWSQTLPLPSFCALIDASG